MSAAHKQPSAAFLVDEAQTDEELAAAHVLVDRYDAQYAQAEADYYRLGNEQSDAFLRMIEAASLRWGHTHPEQHKALLGF